MSWGKTGHLKDADQDPQYTVEQWGNQCRFPHLMFCPGLLLIVLDKPKGPLLNRYPPAEQGWTSGKECAWTRGNEGINTGFEGEILLLWKGTTCGWCSWKPGKMLVRPHSKESKREMTLSDGAKHIGQAGVKLREPPRALGHGSAVAVNQKWDGSDSQRVKKLTTGTQGGRRLNSSEKPTVYLTAALSTQTTLRSWC